MKTIAKRAFLLGVVVIATMFIFNSSSVFAYSSVSIGVSSSEVQLNGADGVVPTVGSAVLATGSQDVTVNTGCSGYKMFVSTTKHSSDNSLHPSDENNSSSISSISGSGELGNNQWGVKTSFQDSFSEIPLYRELGTTDQTANPTPLYTSSNVPSGSSNTIYFGANVDSSLLAGDYSGEILYTAIMDARCYKSNVSVILDTGINVEGVGFYDVGEDVTLSYATWPGFHFTSWETDGDDITLETAEGGGESSGAVTFKAPNRDVLLKVHAAPNNYTVVFNRGDATGDPEFSSTSFTHNITYGTIVLPGVGSMKKEGYVFHGWSYSMTNQEYKYGTEARIRDLVEHSDMAYVNNATITMYPVWIKIEGEMQDFVCSNIDPGDVIALTDTRENGINAYTITRFPTTGEIAERIPDIAGKCIMGTNLNFGSSLVGEASGSTIQVSTFDSTFDKDSGDDASGTGVEEISYSDHFEDLTYISRGSSWNNTNSASNRQYTSLNGSGYYSWGAAMVSCPRGWRLPTATEISGETGMMRLNYEQYLRWQNNYLLHYPYNFERSGLYYSLGLFDAGESGGYPTSSQQSGRYIDMILIQTSPSKQVGYKNYGRTVRCVNENFTAPDTIDSISSMQEMTKEVCTNSNLYDAKILTDTRDNNTYRVMRARDGNCWMAESLRIAGVTITSEDSNITVPEYTLPEPSENASGFNSSSYDKAQIYVFNYQGKDVGLYNYLALTAGVHGYRNEPYVSEPGVATSDICPKGWRLPTSKADDSEYARLESYYDNAHGELLDRNGLAFQLTGAVENSHFNLDYMGMYWSSDYQSNAVAAEVMIASTYATKGGGYSMYYGMAARCIAK